MGSCAAPSAKGDDKFITTDYLQQCHFQCPGGIAKPGTIKGHFSDQLFHTRLTCLISISELKHTVAVTEAKSVTAFRVLTMAVNPS